MRVTVTDPAGGDGDRRRRRRRVGVGHADRDGRSGGRDAAGSADQLHGGDVHRRQQLRRGGQLHGDDQWGDGQSGAGVVTGADGVFQVAGVHTYSTDGTYSVGVTVSDADGTTATTTSQVTAGDLYAGVTQTLTVASFTDPSTYYTASSFNTTINWGDGLSSTGGFVTKAGANYTVAGLHTYSAAGVYTVQVTVTDPMRNVIAAYDVVQVAAAAGAVLRRGGGRGHERGHGLRAAALFAVPQGYGSYGQYTVTAAWGDGTTSAVTLNNIGGILEATGSHFFAAMGTYAVVVRLFNPAGQCGRRGGEVQAYGNLSRTAPAWCRGTRTTYSRSTYQRRRPARSTRTWTVSAPARPMCMPITSTCQAPATKTPATGAEIEVEVRFTKCRPSSR